MLLLSVECTGSGVGEKKGARSECSRSEQREERRQSELHTNTTQPVALSHD